MSIRHAAAGGGSGGSGSYIGKGETLDLLLDVFDNDNPAAEMVIAAIGFEQVGADHQVSKKLRLRLHLQPQWHSNLHSVGQLKSKTDGGPVLTQQACSEFDVDAPGPYAMSGSPFYVSSQSRNCDQNVFQHVNHFAG